MNGAGLGSCLILCFVISNVESSCPGLKELVTVNSADNWEVVSVFLHVHMVYCDILISFLV